MKICSKCGKEYPATTEYFYKNSYYSDGLAKSCKQCDLLRMKIARDNKNKEKYEKQAKIKAELKQRGTRICTKCGKELPATPDYFYRDARNEDGLRCECKQCQQALYSVYYENKHKEEREQKQKIEQDLKQRNKRICSKCGKELPATPEYFYRNIRSEDGLSVWCKACLKIETTRYHKENYNIIIEKQRKKYQEIKDNPEFKAKRKIWDKNRDLRYKFPRAFSSAISHSLKGAKAGRHWEDLVPYNLEQLRQHIESQFIPPMSWDNYGTYWELDHIIPQNLFNFNSPEDKDFQICWSLANLRPLEKSLNRQRPKDGSDIPEVLKVRIYSML